MITKNLTINSVKKNFEDGVYTPEDLLKACLNVIKKEDPEIHAFISVTKDKAFESLKQNKDSVLYGIPASIKDNFNWVGTKTTASSKYLANYVSPYNATTTQRLLDSGACILGKTNMDAFAHGSSTETSDFFTTLNPWDKTRVPGGSSGGSAASVASGMCVYSIGSETAGSVRGPASWCGVVGFVPTYGRNSRYGLVAMESSLDRPGTLTNSVMDAAILSEVLSGYDSHDATTIPEAPLNVINKLNPDVKGLKIGKPFVYFDDRIDSEIIERIEEILRDLEKNGAEIIDIDLMDPKYAMAVYTVIMRSGVSSNLARFDGIRYGFVSDREAESIIQQIAYNRGDSFGNEAKQRSMTGAYTLSAGYYDAYYKQAQKVRTMIINDFKKVFEGIDVIVAPTMATVAPKLGVTQNNPLQGELADILTEASALAGLPCISVPAGLNSEELPIGVQAIGPQFDELVVLNTGLAIESLFKKV